MSSQVVNVIKVAVYPNTPNLRHVMILVHIDEAMIHLMQFSCTIPL